MQAYNVDLEFKHPQYSKPDLDLETRAGPATDLVQYRTSVSYFLYACEEAVAAFDNRREWQATCDYDLRTPAVLCEKTVNEPVYLDLQLETQHWIRGRNEEVGVTLPDCRIEKNEAADQLIIDGKEIDVPAEYTLLQACEALSAEIRASATTSGCRSPAICRMCLVEVKRPSKASGELRLGRARLPSGSQGRAAGGNLHAFADGEEAREGVMEFLLINHPLDCPICDQGR